MKNRAIVFPILLILLFLSICFSDLETTMGLSPSFPRQQIADNLNDWQYFTLTQESNCTATEVPSNLSDLVAVSYSSDGRYLNASLWLSDLFEQVPRPIPRIPVYSMLLGVVQPNDVNPSVDFVISVYWNATTQSWTKSFQEFTFNDTRLIDEESNYTGFFDNNPGFFHTGKKGHVTFSVDLKELTFPSQYFLAFSIRDLVSKGGNFCGLIDISENAAFIPPTDFSVSPTPSPVEIRQGGNQIIELKVNASTLASPFVYMSSPNNLKGIEVSLEPDNTRIPSAGMSTVLMNVNVDDDVQVRSYSIPIYSKLVFPQTMDVRNFIESVPSKPTLTSNVLPQSQTQTLSEADSRQLKKFEASINDRIDVILSPKPTYVEVITVPYSIEDKIKEFWDAYGDPISLIGGGFVAGLAALFFDKLKERRKRRVKRNSSKAH